MIGPSARAVANMSVLSEYLLPLVRVGGMMLAQKGESGPAEAQSAETRDKVVGGKATAGDFAQPAGRGRGPLSRAGGQGPRHAAEVSEKSGDTV